MQSGPETGNAACGHHNRAQTGSCSQKGRQNLREESLRVGWGGTPGPGSQGPSCPAQASGSEGLRRGSGPLPSLWLLPPPSPKEPSCPLLCAQGKHSAGRWGPAAAGHCNGACCCPRSLSTVAGHTPDTAQDSGRASLSRGVIGGYAENSRVPRRDERLERPFHSSLRNALPFSLGRCGGVCTELGLRLCPSPRGAADLEDPSRNWSGEATPGWAPLGLSWHPFWAPTARRGSPRVEDPRPTSFHTSPQRPP